MLVRPATKNDLDKLVEIDKNDLDKLVEIDKAAYGKYGEDKEYFVEKLASFPKGVLVVEDKGKVTGFIVFELIDKNNAPEDFSEMKLKEPLTGRWMYTVAFTTATNYGDKMSDSKLLIAAEKIAKDEGCAEACVPLSKDHPFKGNGVFEFWEINGYKRIGEIKWVPNSNESVECYFYKKSLV